MVAAALACAALLAALLPSSSAAYHIPGADYSGYATGGGTIRFSISSDGSSVTNLTLTGPIVTGTCTLSSASYSQPTPITNNTFDNGDVSGSFPNVQGARGSYNVFVLAFPTPCRAIGTWTATTGADPTGSAECQAALAQLRQAKRALRKARRKGNEAKIRKLRKKWSQARSARDQVCG